MKPKAPRRRYRMPPEQRRVIKLRYRAALLRLQEAKLDAINASLDYFNSLKPPIVKVEPKLNPGQKPFWELFTCARAELPKRKLKRKP